MITNRGCNEEPQNKGLKAKQKWGRISNFIRFRNIKHEIVRRLWKGVATPSSCVELNW